MSTETSESSLQTPAQFQAFSALTPEAAVATQLGLRYLKSEAIKEILGPIRGLFGKRSPRCPPCPQPDWAALVQSYRNVAERICYRIPGEPTVATRGDLWVRSILTSRI